DGAAANLAGRSAGPASPPRQQLPLVPALAERALRPSGRLCTGRTLRAHVPDRDSATRRRRRGRGCCRSAIVIDVSVTSPAEQSTPLGLVRKLDIAVEIALSYAVARRFVRRHDLRATVAALREVRRP